MASLWIINKAGGLIYNVDYSTTPSGLSSNDYLILAGTLHGIHAITARLSPTVAGKAGGGRPDMGIQQLQANGFDMNVMATATGETLGLRAKLSALTLIISSSSGIKLVLITPPGHSPTPASLLQKAYEAYADQVMKNPFYTAEMPIRIESFDKQIKSILGG
jgi:trafficking protein particle complex subunit 4